DSPGFGRGFFFLDSDKSSVLANNLPLPDLVSIISRGLNCAYEPQLDGWICGRRLPDFGTHRCELREFSCTTATIAGSRQLSIEQPAWRITECAVRSQGRAHHAQREGVASRFSTDDR